MCIVRSTVRDGGGRFTAVWSTPTEKWSRTGIDFGDEIVSVLKEILEWSQDRPAWQRDALRRLVLNGELSDDDIRDLSEICKSAHGLADQQDVIPLAAGHVTDTGAGSGQVTLLSIFHHRGVNALAEDQTLKFVPSLTVVYGDNAAGKTGYIRVLKRACRARGTEEILGNIVSGAAPHKPVVAIRYKVAADGNEQEWTGEGGDKSISRVSVFDSQCAAVYLTRENRCRLPAFRAGPVRQTRQSM